MRLRIHRSTVSLDVWSEQTGEFLPVKKAQMKRFHTDYSYGRLQIAGDAFPIWQFFADPIYYAREPILELNEMRNKLGLSRLVRMPSVRNRIATESGQPYQWPQERLRWDMVEPERDDGDYRARLVLPDGLPVPAINAVLPGDPTLYLTEEAVFEGPPEMQALSSTAENLIPAPALESSAGLRFFQRLGQALPLRLERRVQRVKLPVTMKCDLRRTAMLRPTEYVFVSVRSELPAQGIREVFGPGGWGDAPRSVPGGRKPEQGALVIYNRSAQQHVPALLEELNLHWDNEAQLWRVRVQKGFPDAFVAWLAAVPKDIEVLLDDQLTTLTQNPIDAKIRLDCTEAGVDWFDLAMEVEVANCELTPEELRLLLDAKGGYVRLGQLGWKRLKVNLTDEEDAQLSKLGLGVHDISSEPQRMHVLQLAEAAESRLLPEERTEQIRRRAGELKTRVNPPVPEAIHAELRPYQVEGFHFLAYLSSNRFGGILADDMGLGKTLQTLAWLAWLRGQEDTARPVLVVCPKSVMPNWGSEAERFYPGLRVTQWRGTDPAKLAEAVSGTDVLVLNYAQMRELGAGLQNVSWLAAVLDEGQYIKNPESITARVARSLRADYRLTLSGTPIENRLMDLWSLMAFAMPGVLGNKNQFGKRYGRTDDNHARGRLAARVRPFLLRRTKGQVARDLPDRVEEDVICEMDGMQKTLYSAEYKPRPAHAPERQDREGTERVSLPFSDLAPALAPDLLPSRALLSRGLQSRERQTQRPVRPARTADRGGPQGARFQPVRHHARDPQRPDRGKRMAVLLPRRGHREPGRTGREIPGRRRRRRVPHFAQSGRVWTEPHGGLLRRALRPMVESRRGKPGDRPHPPHRPDEQGDRLPVAHQRQHRGKKSGPCNARNAPSPMACSGTKPSPRA